MNLILEVPLEEDVLCLTKRKVEEGKKTTTLNPKSSFFLDYLAFWARVPSKSEIFRL